MSFHIAINSRRKFFKQVEVDWVALLAGSLYLAFFVFVTPNKSFLTNKLRSLCDVHPRCSARRWVPLVSAL